MLKFFNVALDQRLRQQKPNINPMQHGLLSMLIAEVLTTSELSQCMGMDPSTLVRSIDTMERKGLVE